MERCFYNCTYFDGFMTFSLVCLTDWYPNLNFDAQTSNHPVNFTLEKYQTQVSPSLELINGAYLPSHPWFEPGLSKWEAFIFLSYLPSELSSIADYHGGWHLNKRNSVILIRLYGCNTHIFQLGSPASHFPCGEGYAPPMISNESGVRIWCLSSVELTEWSEVCAWKVGSKDQSMKQKYQSHTLLTNNFKLYAFNSVPARSFILPVRGWQWLEKFFVKLKICSRY